MDSGLVVLASPSPLFWFKIFKREDLGVDLMWQILENKGLGCFQAVWSRQVFGAQGF
jgi:hypothetical protein